MLPPPDWEVKDTQKTSKLERIYGKDRILTAINIAEAMRKDLGIDRFENIIVTTGNNYADALSGSVLGVKNSSPILLISGSKAQNDEVIKYIRNHLAATGTITILGGEEAVPIAIETQLRALGNVVRIDGAHRYETNLGILKSYFSDELTSKQNLLICYGKNYPDALSASATGYPILLVEDKLTSKQKAFLSEIAPMLKNIFIIGGPQVVNQTIESELTAYKTPIRVFGANRYATSLAIAKRFFKSSEEVVMATGKNFPDGLVGGILANERKAPLLLTSDTLDFHTAYKYIHNNNIIKKGAILGGTAVVSDDAISVTTQGKKKDGLLKIGKNYYYAKTDGNLEKNVFKDVSGNRYYFSKSYVAERNNFFQVGGKWYGAKDDATLAKSGWARTGKYTYYFNKDYTAHDACLDAKKVMDRIGWDLWKAYKWIGDNFSYAIISNASPAWGSLYFARIGFRYHKGGCTIIASTFYVMAKMLNYDVIQVQGYVRARYNRTQHSWTFITHDGVKWIYDPEWYVEHHSRGPAFKIKNGDTRWYYWPDTKTMVDVYQG